MAFSHGSRLAVTTVIWLMLWRTISETTMPKHRARSGLCP
jgi:hypothetical protein